MARLAGKVALVTGAGQGIGRGIARTFAREGAAVLIAEVEADRGARLAREIETEGGRARAVQCDVADLGSVEACVETLRDTYGRLDVLVNNAVSGVEARPLLEWTASDLRVSFESGLVGTFHFMQRCYPDLARRGGSVINLGSAAGYEGHVGLAGYAATKEAIRALSRVAAREWGPEGIRVNVLCPFGDSPGWRDWEAADPEESAKFAAARPLGRVGDCEQDIGRAALFLACDDSAFVTGMTLPADGGGAMIG